jgi:hypothetical protein
MVGVAQLVEHLVVVQVAAGSSPVTHPKAQCRSHAGHLPDGRVEIVTPAPAGDGPFGANNHAGARWTPLSSSSA